MHCNQPKSSGDVDEAFVSLRRVILLLPVSNSLCLLLAALYRLVGQRMTVTQKVTHLKRKRGSVDGEPFRFLKVLIIIERICHLKPDMLISA